MPPGPDGGLGRRNPISFLRNLPGERVCRGRQPGSGEPEPGRRSAGPHCAAHQGHRPVPSVPLSPALGVFWDGARSRPQTQWSLSAVSAATVFPSSDELPFHSLFRVGRRSGLRVGTRSEQGDTEQMPAGPEGRRAAGTHPGGGGSVPRAPSVHLPLGHTTVTLRPAPKPQNGPRKAAAGGRHGEGAGHTRWERRQRRRCALVGSLSGLIYSFLSFLTP